MDRRPLAVREPPCTATPDTRAALERHCIALSKGCTTKRQTRTKGSAGRQGGRRGWGRAREGRRRVYMEAERVGGLYTSRAALEGAERSAVAAPPTRSEAFGGPPTRLPGRPATIRGRVRGQPGPQAGGQRREARGGRSAAVPRGHMGAGLLRYATRQALVRGASAAVQNCRVAAPSAACLAARQWPGLRGGPASTAAKLSPKRPDFLTFGQRYDL